MCVRGRKELGISGCRSSSRWGGGARQGCRASLGPWGSRGEEQPTGTILAALPCAAGDPGELPTAADVGAGAGCSPSGKEPSRGGF